MLKKISWILFFPLFVSTSCIEIIDDLLLNNDGSGTFKFTLNLSSSKVKVNSILALDTFDGQRVPEKEEIQSKIRLFKQVLKSNPGISKVEITEDYDDYIFKLNCAFTDPYCLQDAFYQAYDSLNLKENKVKKFEWIQWSSKSISRSIPEIVEFKNYKVKDEDKELLKTGYYTSITRFENEIKKVNNPSAQISKSKKACLIKVDMNSLKENRKLLETKVSL